MARRGCEVGDKPSTSNKGVNRSARNKFRMLLAVKLARPVTPAVRPLHEYAGAMNQEEVMLLEPLQLWVCDTCKQIIETVDDGWLEW